MQVVHILKSIGLNSRILAGLPSWLSGCEMPQPKKSAEEFEQHHEPTVAWCFAPASLLMSNNQWLLAGQVAVRKLAQQPAATRSKV